MKDFIIVTDSSNDLPAAIIEKYGIVVIPMAITINDRNYKHYYNYQELSKFDYYNALRNKATGTTSGVNVQDAFNEMRKIAEANKDIIYISLSSNLSCSYQNVVLAAENLQDEFPSLKIEVIDSKSACVGVGLLLVLAAQAKEKGSSFYEVVEIVCKKIKSIKHYFTVDDLSALNRSGRISHLTAMTGTLLNIKPILTIDSDGRIQNYGKVRGRKAAINQIIDGAIKETRDGSAFIVAHADSINDAKSICMTLQEKFPNSEIIISDIGPIIGIHVGAGTLAVIYSCGQDD